MKVDYISPSEWEKMSLEEKIDWLFYSLVVENIYNKPKKEKE